MTPHTLPPASPVPGTAAGPAAQESGVPVTGEQYELSAGTYRAVVTGLGAGLRELSQDGSPVILGYQPDELPWAADGQLLTPWPNRVDHGRYRFRGADYQLDISETGNGNAIHGLTRFAAWALTRHEPDRVVLTHVPHGYAGYPFSLEIAAEYRLTAAAGLQVTISAANRGTRAAPYGFGQHPYLTAGPAALDEWELTLPATRWLPLDQRGIPSGPVRDIAGTEGDFRQPTGDRRHTAGPCLHRPAAGERRPGLGASALGRMARVTVGRPGLRVASGVHQRQTGRRAPPESDRDRADDVPAQRLRQR